MRRPLPHSIRESVEVIPSSNAVDSAMYERDKQIYKCSTMRPLNKSDKHLGMTKPSILNCPLPEIPKQECDMSGQETIKMDKVQPMVTRTLHRQTKNLPTGKAIPPPKIADICPPKSQQSQSIHPIANPKKQQEQSLKQQQNTQQFPINSQHTMSPSNLPPPPPPEINQTPINPNDDSNYAVTEL